MLSRFHLIPERHGHTGRRTEGQTDRQISYININSHVSVLTFFITSMVLTRDKN